MVDVSQSHLTQSSRLDDERRSSSQFSMVYTVALSMMDKLECLAAPAQQSHPKKKKKKSAVAIEAKVLSINVCVSRNVFQNTGTATAMTTRWPPFLSVPTQLQLLQQEPFVLETDYLSFYDNKVWHEVVEMLRVPGVTGFVECLLHEKSQTLPIPDDVFYAHSRLYANEFMSYNRFVPGYRFYIFGSGKTPRAWPNAQLFKFANVCAEQSNKASYYRQDGVFQFPRRHCVVQIDAAPTADLRRRCVPDAQALEWTHTMYKFHKDATLPAPSQSIDQWMQQPEMQQRRWAPLIRADERLSPFGARVVRLMMQLEVGRDVHGAHLAVLICMIRSHTAYWRGEGSHANALLVGAADVVLDVAKSVLIPNTASVATDTTRCMHGVPAGAMDPTRLVRSSARQDKSIAQATVTQLVSGRNTNICRRFSDELTYEMCVTQAMTFYMMNAIELGAMPDVTFAAFALLMPLYCSVLSARFGISVANCEIECVLLFTRVLVLWQAVWWLYGDERSPVYGQAPSKHHTLLASPMLKDSEEIVLVALDLLSSQLVPAETTAVVGAVRKLACAAALAADAAQVDASRELKYVYTSTALDVFTANVAQSAGVPIATVAKMLETLQTTNVRSEAYIRNEQGIIVPNRDADLIELHPICVMGDAVLIARAWTTHHPGLSLHQVALQSCRHKHTPANAVYISGTPLSDATPQLLATSVMQPANDRVLRLQCQTLAHSVAALLGAPADAAYVDAAVGQNTVVALGTAIECSVDQYATEQRLLAIGVQHTPQLQAQFDPRAGVNVNAPARYPIESVAEVAHAVKRVRRQEKEQVFGD
jgi:hypothetical protein